MAQKLTANMPSDLVIGDGYRLRFTAVDPTDGSVVSGVVVSAVNVDTEDAGSSGGGTVSDPILIGVSV